MIEATDSTTPKAWSELFEEYVIQDEYIGNGGAIIGVAHVRGPIIHSTESDGTGFLFVHLKSGKDSKEKPYFRKVRGKLTSSIVQAARNYLVATPPSPVGHVFGSAQLVPQDCGGYALIIRDTAMISSYCVTRLVTDFPEDIADLLVKSQIPQYSVVDGKVLGVPLGAWASAIAHRLKEEAQQILEQKDIEVRVDRAIKKTMIYAFGGWWHSQKTFDVNKITQTLLSYPSLLLALIGTRVIEESYFDESFYTRKTEEETDA